MKLKKHKESEGETDYEYDEKTGKLKLDSAGRPIAKMEIDEKTGKPKLDETGNPITKRKHRADKDGNESTYEVNWKEGKYIYDPATG